MFPRWISLLTAFVSLFIIIQLLPVNPGNPPTAATMKIVGKARPVMKKACLDCHSHETEWPWYSQVAPVSWFIVRHVNEGRDQLNFATWYEYEEERKIKLYEEIIEVLQKDEMPLRSYKWLHPEARLTNTEKDIIIRWARSNRDLLMMTPIPHFFPPVP
jgi:hypothetical protein